MRDTGSKRNKIQGERREEQLEEEKTKMEAASRYGTLVRQARIRAIFLSVHSLRFWDKDVQFIQMWGCSQQTSLPDEYCSGGGGRRHEGTGSAWYEPSKCVSSSVNSLRRRFMRSRDNAASGEVHWGIRCAVVRGIRGFALNVYGDAFFKIEFVWSKIEFVNERVSIVEICERISYRVSDWNCEVKT